MDGHGPPSILSKVRFLSNKGLGGLVASLGGPVSFLHSEFELVGASPRGLQSWLLF